MGPGLVGSASTPVPPAPSAGDVVAGGPAAGPLAISLESATFSAPPDTRALGAQVVSACFRPGTGAVLPALPTMLYVVLGSALGLFAARAWSGLSVASFQKAITGQEVSREGLRGIGPDAVTLATAEQLDAHAAAVSRRLARLEAAS